MKTWNVTFLPEGSQAAIDHGTLLSAAMQALNIPVQLPCGGTGRCGKCLVEIMPSAPEPDGFERLHLSTEELARGLRLACRTRVDRDMTVRIGLGLRENMSRILATGEERIYDLAPAVTKTCLELPEPSLEDQVSDHDRIARALNMGTLPADVEVLRELPSILCGASQQVTAVITDGRLTGVEPGDTTSRCYGIAFDIGTTTVVGTLIDFTTGHEAARASRLNTQAAFGDDTISRIRHAIEESGGRDDLHGRIRDVLNEIVRETALIASIETTEIYEATVAGNTTMMHLLLRLDPQGLSRIPFAPAVTAPLDIIAADTGIGINPRGNVHVLPSIAGFVGADTVAVMLATDFLLPGPPRLVVDIGTNGELALVRDGDIMVCSTAAGPALEGAEISCGMRAAAGAIERVDIDDGEVVCEVIGGIQPAGICGSGIIDLTAALLDMGIITQYGAFEKPESLRSTLPDSLIDRIITVNDQPAFLVSSGNSGDHDVVFTQRDVRQVQLAKGAIAAGMQLLLNDMGVELEKLHEILVAGAFGNYIRPSSAKRIGLLPNLPLERVRFIGNAASVGARMALLSTKSRSDAESIRKKSRHLELAALPAFTETLSEHMLFP